MTDISASKIQSIANTSFPYDETLLEKTRVQWQFGDWENLAKLDLNVIQHHPERAKLLLLVSAARIQIGNFVGAKQYLRIAKDWGVNRQLMLRILLSGVHNSLGRALFIKGQCSEALKHFETAISVGTPGTDAKLIADARSHYQTRGLVAPELTIQASNNSQFTSTQSNETALTRVQDIAPIRKAWEQGRWDFLAKLDNAELPEFTNRADIAMYAACGYQQLDQTEGLNRSTKLAIEWGCSKDRLRSFLAAGIRNTLAIAEVLSANYENAAKCFFDSLRVENSTPNAEILMARIGRQIKPIKMVDQEKSIASIKIFVSKLLN